MSKRTYRVTGADGLTVEATSPEDAARVLARYFGKMADGHNSNDAEFEFLIPGAALTIDEDTKEPG